MEDTSATKPKPPRTKKYMLVRYGRMRALGLFEHNESQIPSVPTRVVIKTEKGMELGSIVGSISAIAQASSNWPKSSSRNTSTTPKYRSPLSRRADSSGTPRPKTSTRKSISRK